MSRAKTSDLAASTMSFRYFNIYNLAFSDLESTAFSSCNPERSSCISPLANAKSDAHGHAFTTPEISCLNSRWRSLSTRLSTSSALAAQNSKGHSYQEFAVHIITIKYEATIKSFWAMMQNVPDIPQKNFSARQLRQLVDSRPARTRQTSSLKAGPEWEKAWSDTVRKAKEGDGMLTISFT